MRTFWDSVIVSTGLSVLPETLTETVTRSQLPLSPASRRPPTPECVPVTWRALHYHLVFSLTARALVVPGV